MKLESERLIVIPLTLEQMKLYILPDPSLELDLGLVPDGRAVPEEVIEVIQTVVLPQLSLLKEQYVFYTFWTIILKSENKMVGDMMIKGMPDEQGAIEIGYGTYEKYQGKGYMTEAVGLLLDWALSQPSVKKVKAETRKENIASQKILQNNGFIIEAEDQDYLHWHLSK
ncbi:MAG: GNAT family N-acetyltransferase [Bacteroidia bacterium]|nr:GNAT family N-acetyltransferase [Bacteroidia bacterium]